MSIAKEDEILLGEEKISSLSDPMFAAHPAVGGSRSSTDENHFDEFVRRSSSQLEREGVDPEIAAFFRLLLLEGRKQYGDSGVSLDTKPSWVDDEKLQVGQHFAQEYYFGVMLAEVASLNLLFSAPDSLQALVFSGNSDTPLKAFRRYLSTERRMRPWYTGDLWAAEGEARRSLQYVRAAHDRYRCRLNSGPPEERARCTALQVPVWAEGMADAVRRDFPAAGAAGEGGLCPFTGLISSHNEWLNQMEMSFTQFGFAALVVTYPEVFGASGATEQEMEGFVHLWEVLGHLLGIERRFNFCAGGLRAVRQRSDAILRGFARPLLAHVDASWEHMSRCLASGIGFYSPQLTFEVLLIHTLRVFGPEPASHLLQKLTAPQRLQSHLLAWAMRWAMPVAPLRALFNRHLRSSLEHAQKRLNDSEWLRERDARAGYASFLRREEQGRTTNVVGGGSKEAARRSTTETSLRFVASASAVILILATVTWAPHHGLAQYTSSLF